MTNNTINKTIYLRTNQSNTLVRIMKSLNDKHKTQSGLKTNIDNSVTGTWAVGCLCELNPDYLPFNEWNLGFAHITIDKDGNFTVDNKQVIGGKIY